MKIFHKWCIALPWIGPSRSHNSCNSIWNLKSNYGRMSCPSAMSPPAIWPPHSSKQIFEAGIRTRCHAYLNDQAGGSHQHSPWGWLRRGLGGRTRAGLEGHPSHLGLQLQPHIRSSLGALHESKSRLEKKNNNNAKREVFAVPWAAVQTTPNTQPLNKQGDSISEVELNSFKQFSGKKKKEAANWSLLGITQRSLFTVSFP